MRLKLNILQARQLEIKLVMCTYCSNTLLLSHFLFIVVSGGSKPKGDVGCSSTRNAKDQTPPMVAGPDVGVSVSAGYTAVGSGRPQRSFVSKVVKK